MKTESKWASESLIITSSCRPRLRWPTLKLRRPEKKKTLFAIFGQFWAGFLQRRGKMSKVLMVRELVTHWWPQALGQPYIAQCQPLLWPRLHIITQQSVAEEATLAAGNSGRAVPTVCTPRRLRGHFFLPTSPAPSCLHCPPPSHQFYPSPPHLSLNPYHAV